MAVPAAASVYGAAPVQFGVPPAAGAVVLAQVTVPKVTPLPSNGVSVNVYVPGPPLLLTVTRYCTGELVPALMIVLVTVMFGAFGVMSRQTLTVCALPLFGVTVVALFNPPALVVGADAGHSALPAVGVTALVTVNGIDTV